jgi:LysM repeat protein
MYKIASTAVSLALLGAVANTPLSNIKAQTVSAAKAAKPAVSAPVVPATPAQPAPVMVAVQSGDSLTTIADAHSTTYVRLFDANDVVANPNVITTGMQLRIPTTDEQLPDRIATVAAPVIVETANYSASTRPSAVTYPAVSGNDAKAFIYSHESGNNPSSTSPNGCYGLGQDCNGRVRALCGADYACQDEFFTNYAMSRYGSWEGALAFWQQHHWW